MRVRFEARRVVPGGAVIAVLDMNIRTTRLELRDEGDLYHLKLTGHQVKKLEKFEQEYAHDYSITLDGNLMWALDENNWTHTWR